MPHYASLAHIFLPQMCPFLPRMHSFSLDAFPPHGRVLLLRTRSHHATDVFLFFGCIPSPWMCSSATDTFSSCHGCVPCLWMHSLPMDVFFCYGHVLIMPRMRSFSLDAFPSYGRVLLLRTRSHATYTFFHHGCVLLPWMHSSLDAFPSHGHVLTPHIHSLAMGTFSCHGYVLLPHMHTSATPSSHHKSHATLLPIRPLPYLGVSKPSLVVSPGFTGLLMIGCHSSP